MTDKEITKTSGEINSNKIKAIYPHITVSGDVDKPYYNIDWYDIEKKTMYRGYSSYKLPIVRKWLQENFEVVEADIDDLINRQQAEIERLKKLLEEADVNYNKCAKRFYKEGVKEFAENCKKGLRTGEIIMDKSIRDIIDNLVKETVGDTE